MLPGDVPTIELTEITPDAIVLDVREDDEWTAGHIDGARHVPMFQVPQHAALADDLSPDVPIVVVCKMGGRSAQVTAWLNQHGYQALNLDGGMVAWAHAGRPMVSEDGPTRGSPEAPARRHDTTRATGDDEHVRARWKRSAVEAPERPQVVAHRGASSTVAEHTLAAYVSAIEAGAQGLECDVRLTRDGHLVCVHDRTVNRTSDGSGKISELSLEGLESLDFTSWHADLPRSADELLGDSPYLAGVAPDLAENGRVLTLERLLQLVADAGRPMRLLIETKHPTRYGGLVEKELVELLARFGWAGRAGPPESIRAAADMDSRVVVMSFAPTALRRVKLLAPDIPTVLLMERRLPGLRDGLLPAGVPVAGPGLHLVQADPGFVERAHARGNRVFVWTVNERDEVDLVRRLGVDTIITDRPAEVLAQLDEPS